MTNSPINHSQDQPQDKSILAEEQAFAEDWWLANPDITPLKVNQAVLDLLLYGNAYLDVDTGFHVKAKDIKNIAE